MRSPNISLIIPVYNVEDYLPDCLDSVLAQSYADFEVVAVNDGSTDRSREILADYAKKDSRIRIIDQANRGLAGARNTGVAAANGMYIAFVDSDDYIDSDYLSVMYSNANEFNADISISGRYIDCGGQSSHENRPAFTSKRLGPIEAARALNSYRSFDMSMHGKLFLASLFKGLAFPEGKNSEDQFMCYRLILRSNCSYYEDRPLYYYRHREGSISRSSRVNVFPIEASHEQLEYIRRYVPALTIVAETSCFFSQVAVYNAFAVRDLEMPNEIANVVLKEPKRFLGSVIRNEDIPGFKKIQAITYCFARPVYKAVYLAKKG